MIYEKLFYFHCETGTCGTDDSQVMSHVDGTHSLDETASQLAIENAECYGEDGYIACSDCGADLDNWDSCPDCGGEADWIENENVSGSWEPYQPEKHNSILSGGADSIFNQYPLAFEFNGAWYNPIGESDIERQMIAWQESEIRELRVRDKQWESSNRGLERKINTIRNIVS